MYDDLAVLTETVEPTVVKDVDTYDFLELDLNITSMHFELTITHNRQLVNNGHRIGLSWKNRPTPQVRGHN